MKKKSVIQSTMSVASASTKAEVAQRDDFFRLFRKSPIAQNEVLSNLGLFLNRQTLSRILFMHHLYQQVLPIHGVIMEFGVRWGQNLALFSSFRGIYEPFNYTRKIIGFDTFEGFPSVHPNDGSGSFVKKGAYGVSRGYSEYLDKILSYHEQESPISHIRKYELVKGDAVREVKRYLKRNPETIIALAFFDLDLFEPTLRCLSAIRDYLPKGAILAFDEVGSHSFPGETLALKQALGLSKCQLQRVPWNPNTSYLIVGN